MCGILYPLFGIPTKLAVPPVLAWFIRHTFYTFPKDFGPSRLGSGHKVRLKDPASRNIGDHMWAVVFEESLCYYQNFIRASVHAELLSRYFDFY